MGYLAKAKQIADNLKQDNGSITPQLIDLKSIPDLPITKFSKMDIAVEIHSEILNENIWFCSNQTMVDQLLEDDPTAVCYTADELQKLIELNPSKEFLKKINDIKTVFNHSKLKE